MPAPAPAGRVVWDAKPSEVAGRLHGHFSGFWDQSLALGALWIRHLNHQLKALKIPGVRAFFFPPKYPPVPISNLTEHKTPPEISFQIPAFNSYVLLELFLFTFHFFLSSWRDVFKLSPRCPRAPGVGWLTKIITTEYREVKK